MTKPISELFLSSAGRLAAKASLAEDGGVVLRYESQWANARGAYPLSISLPLDAEPESGAERWLSGLLPYGALRRDAEAIIGVADQSEPLKSFSLLARLGGDAPGSFTISAAKQSEGDGEEQPVAAGIRPVENLGALLENWADNPLLLSEQGVSHTLCEDFDLRLPVVLSGAPAPRLSLAQNGAPSTHYLLCEPRGGAGAIENRAFHLALAATIGIAITGFRTLFGAGRRLLLIPRDDRERRGGGWIRLHRESLAQAMGLSPEQRYGREAHEIADLETVFQWAGGVLPGAERAKLLDVFLFNALIGAPDAHLLRYALRLQPGPAPALAPLTELASAGYPSPKERRFAQRVGGASRWPERVSAAQWRSFAEAAKLEPSAVLARIRSIAEAIRKSAEPVAAKLEVDPHLEGPLLGRFAREARDRATDMRRRLQFEDED